MINTNFVKLLAALAKNGVSQRAVAGKCGCTPSAICDIANGNTLDPRFNTGMAIIQLHEYHCKGNK